jgi:fatty acid desaturase
MSPERVPVFLARRSYRRRRVADAARLLPLAGGILFCVPLLWQGAGGGARTVVAVIYVFGLWGLLVVVSGVVSRHLRGDEDERADQEGSAGEGPQ